MEHININKTEVALEKQALRRRVATYIYKNLEHKDLTSFFNEAETIFEKQAKNLLSTIHSLKVNCLIEVLFCRKFAIHQHRGVDVEHDGEEIERDDDYDNGIERIEIEGDDEEIEGDNIQIETDYDDYTAEDDIECVGDPIFFQTKMKQVLHSTDLNDWFKVNVALQLSAQVDQVEQRGSGWTLYQINSMKISFNKYKRFSSAGKSYINLPPSIRAKRARINVKNKDNCCFMWAILSALHHGDGLRPNSAAQYRKFMKELKFDGIEFPVKICNIDRFEQLNPHISVNVYFYQRELNPLNDRYMNVLQVLRMTKKVAENHIHLLLLWKYKKNDRNNDDDADNGADFVLDNENDTVYTDDIYDIVQNLNKTHYVWIKNLSALVQSQTTSRRSKKYICDRCLYCFHKEEKLRAHMLRCEDEKHIVRKMPNWWNKIVQFKNFKNQMEAVHCLC